MLLLFVFFFRQKTAYEMCGRDWSSDVCSADLRGREGGREGERERGRADMVLGCGKTLSYYFATKQSGRLHATPHMYTCVLQRQITAVTVLPQYTTLALCEEENRGKAVRWRRDTPVCMFTV